MRRGKCERTSLVEGFLGIEGRQRNVGYIGGHGVQFSKKKNERDLAENERDLAELDKHLAVVLRAWSVPRPFHPPGPFLEPSRTVS